MKEDIEMKRRERKEGRKRKKRDTVVKDQEAT